MIGVLCYKYEKFMYWVYYIQLFKGSPFFHLQWNILELNYLNMWMR